MDTRSRVYLSVALAVVGVVLAVVAGTIPSSAETERASGTVIDYAEYDTLYAEAETEDFGTAQELLEYVCEESSLGLVMNDDGTIAELDGYLSGDDGRSWELWAVLPGETGWTKLEAPYTQDPSAYTITSWAYRADGEEPTVAVDAAGNPVYGYSQAYRVVSLSPTVTEIVVGIGAENILVGADYYSNYPESVQAGKDDGSITMVGTYTSPSFEVIVGTNPDMVFCDGSQYSHFQVAERLKDVGVNAIVLYGGESVEDVLDNIFIAGQVIGYDLAAAELIDESEYVFDRLSEALEGYADGSLKVMIALEPDMSPWVAGEDTYMDGILTILSADNAFGDWSGWVHITSDMITEQDPDVIIIITEEYEATQDEYDYLYSHLSAQWQLTEAYQNGRVYMVCESAAEMFQRYGPRTAQVAELIAMMLYPEAFGTELPMYIGDDYQDYLDYSRDMDV